VKSWQDNGSPYFGIHYTALTPHQYWDGQTHYWTGMVVKGQEDQDPANPNCCHAPETFEREVRLRPTALRQLRRGLYCKGVTHRSAGEAMGLGLSGMRQRLYGKKSFSAAEFRTVCRMAGVGAGGAWDASDGATTGR